MNGCDEEPVPAPDRRQRFVEAYVGSIYLDRDPRPLFRAARTVVTELGLTPEQITIEFMGKAQRYGGKTLDMIAAEEGVGAYVRGHPARPRAEALTFLARASVLLSLPQDSEMAIQSKTVEYFQFEVWILALAEQNSATEQLLRGTGADTVSAHDIEGLTAVFRSRYQEWERNVRPAALSRDPRFARRNQATRLIHGLSATMNEPHKDGGA
jgi:hypothetical protein